MNAPRAGTAPWGGGLLCLLAAALLPGERPAIVGVPTFPVAGVAVDFYVVVTDDRGRFVTGLRREDFEIEDDGVPQTIEHFSLGTEMPLSLGLLLDTSPSQAALLPAERDEAMRFLRSVLGPDDQAFVMRFDLDVELLQSFTGDRARLTQAIARTRINTGDRTLLPGSRGRPAGGTRLHDALFLASNELMKTEHGRKVVVLVTDGMDQGSLVRRRAALEAAEKADVIVYAVAIGDPSFYWLRNQAFQGEEALTRLTQATGGRLLRVDREHDTAAAFRELAVELRAHYRLGYSPHSRREAAFHRVRVRVVSGKYRVRTRRGYYARGD